MKSKINSHAENSVSDASFSVPNEAAENSLKGAPLFMDIDNLAKLFCEIIKKDEELD